jgi:hypothetical protein
LYAHFYDLSEHDPAWDAGDSLYHIVKSAPDSLKKNQAAALKSRTQRGLNPLRGIGAWVGYGR